MAVELDAACGNTDLSDERTKQRRLAGAGRAEDAEHFTGARREIDPAKDRLVAAYDPEGLASDRGSARRDRSTLVIGRGGGRIVRFDVSVRAAHGFGTGIEPFTCVAVTRAVASSIVAFSAWIQP